MHAWFYVPVNQMQSGATFVKVDRIYNAKDNSPALLFQGVVFFVYSSFIHIMHF